MKLLLGSRHIIEVDHNDESKATQASMKQVSKRISEELNPTSTVQEYLSVLDTELGDGDTDDGPSVLSAFGDDETRDDGSEREASGDGCATEVTESTQKISHLFDELTAFHRMSEEPGWDSELEELMQCIRREVLQELTRHGVDAAELDALELETHSMTPQPPGALASVRQMFGCDGE